MTTRRHRQGTRTRWAAIAALVLAVLAVVLLLLGLLASRGGLPYWMTHPFDHSETTTGQNGQAVHQQDGKVGLTDNNEKYAPTPAKSYRNAQCSLAPEHQAQPGPDQWEIPALGQSAPLQSAQPTSSGSVALPDAPAGIVYGPAAPLDASTGTTLLAGHVDHGPGDLSRKGGELSPWGHLHELNPCAHVYATGPGGDVHEFVVTDLYTVDQDKLTDETELFEATGKRQLAMVTCSGPTVNDAGGAFQFNYQSNLVVKATPVNSDDTPEGR
ncbi:class F sortase [Kocuria massiliensis]|uniref:class F sortase n=1 Tax=Kocuria massiliensis TaxID=1926282 RepID=UPI000A1CDE5F|nr:class F sortase [Kocuria massiliensis]